MRTLLSLMLVLMLTACAGGGGVPPFKPGDGVVTLVNQIGHEKATIRYREAGFIIPPAMAQIDHLMRDMRTGMTGSTDPNLIIFLDELTATLGLPGDVPIVITSGYRSPMTNNGLRKASSKVAENSFHLYGKALDFKIPGVDSGRIAQTALAMKRGGVATYGSSGHVHIDTGPVRTWKTN